MNKEFFSRLYWFFQSEIGIDFIKILQSPSRIFVFLHNYYKFKRLLDRKMSIKLMPSIHDKFHVNGNLNQEYFLQDMLVAQHIFKRGVTEHFDVGSRIDGFVSNVASFCNVTVFDIRNIDTKLENIIFKKSDISSIDFNYPNQVNSLSCLHTLEHIGLGRYGDTIDINSFSQALKNLSNLLYPESGILYLSTLVGKECIYYNSHRIYNIHLLLHEFKNNHLSLISLNVWTKNNQKLVRYEINDATYSFLENVDYSLCVFILNVSSTKS